MYKVPLYSISVVLYCLSTCASAQEKIFEREYTYKASELDSKASCRAVALNQLRSTLLNELGVYVKSERLLKTTEVSGKFSQDFAENISTVSAGITKVQVIDEIWNGEIFWMKAAITIDEKELAESLKRIANDKQRVIEMENLKRQLDQANIELENLRKRSQSEEGKDAPGTKEELNKKYNDQINSISSADYFLSGNTKYDQRDYQGAIDDYSKAIEINPKNRDAYNNTGTAKCYLKDYRGALMDFNIAIRLDPGYIVAYYNRANAKDDLKDYDGAINDYNVVIKLDPRNSSAYNNRGIAKSHIQDYEGAIKDYNKAIEISPEDSELFLNRGLAKVKVGQKDGGCRDFNRAKELGNEKVKESIKKVCDN